MDLLPKVAEALDEPIGDQAMLPLYLLAHEAHRHVKVVLSGEGADEVFGGYSYYRKFVGQGRLSRQPIDAESGSRRLVVDIEAELQSGFPIVCDIAERRRLITLPLEEGPDAWEQDLIDWLDEAETPLQRATAADTTTWLPDNLLVKFDRMAMAHSLEGRAPFLASDVLEIGLNLPDHQRIDGAISKVLLRSAAANRLPTEILKRRKQGFVLPMRDWLKKWFDAYGGPASFFEQYEVPGIDPIAEAEIAVSDMDRGGHRERLLFALVLLGVWRKSFERRRRELRSSLVAA
jgi:asparagine synthase (glutamine-hydrolysing)